MVNIVACENIRFFSLFAAGKVSRGGTREERSSARNVHSGEERGETDVFAGYQLTSRSVAKSAYFATPPTVFPRNDV